MQPGGSLQGKGNKINVKDLAEVTGGSLGIEDSKSQLMYIEVPVNFVYSIPTGNSGSVFLGAGPYAGVGIHAKATRSNESDSGSFNDAGLKTFDAGLNFLAGFKLTNGFLINGGYGLGLTNIVKGAEDSSARIAFFQLESVISYNLGLKYKKGLFLRKAPSFFQ
ncbi:outer membrane beta-barrel protein [Sphingobacterium multivorum]|uniref:outer membrane beta-barrel protein n=1 Tax=Sphingobacterium multivorum TaxID=28454 RepID=UPI0031BB608D